MVQRYLNPKFFKESNMDSNIEVSISGDNTLRVDEIGIPIKLALSMQIPETVRSYNKDKLNIYYMNKRNIYPGCSGVEIRGTGKYHKIEHLDPTYELQEGDVVLRDIVEGDYVGFNRQPSILFGQIGSHKVKIMEKSSTIRINVSACAPYNADSPVVCYFIYEITKKYHRGPNKQMLDRLVK